MKGMKVLNQVIAVEKGIKTRNYSEFTELHKQSHKIDTFNGFVKTYMKKDEEGEDYPQEKKKVTTTVPEQIKLAVKLLTEMYDITACKEYANCNAKADIVVEGKVIAKDVPATYLLFLEKQIIDLRTFIFNLPALDETEDWTIDVNSGLYKTEPTVTHKSKKVQKPITLAEATDKHPAQVQLISEDIMVGYWNTVKSSGAMPAPIKKELLERAEKFSSAVKCAREKANMQPVEDIHIGAGILSYIFNGQ